MLPVVKLLQSHPIVVNDAEGRDGSRTALDERVNLSCQKEQELARELDASDSPAEGWMELS